MGASILERSRCSHARRLRASRQTLPLEGSTLLVDPQFPNERTLILADGKTIMGFAVVQIVGDEAYLMNILVSPTERCRGHGTRLLESVQAWCQSNQARRIFLDVDAANSHAIGLYQKMGFERITDRPKAYPRGENSVVMKKEIM